MPYTTTIAPSAAPAPRAQLLRQRILHTACACAAALCLAGAPSTTLAKNSTGHKSAATDSAAKKKSVSKVTYQRSSSEESRAERDRRMYRECKGMHNAGACRGYTR
ncbi:MAG: hypothetical protein ACLGIY_25590 [Betaproteobacteria bacterium]